MTELGVDKMPPGGSSDDMCCNEGYVLGMDNEGLVHVFKRTELSKPIPKPACGGNVAIGIRLQSARKDQICPVCMRKSGAVKRYEG